jgi:DNA repair protein RecN (Recombination protein N)
MLAGLDHTDTGRAHAEELLAAARAHREADRATAASTPGTRRKGRRAPATAG